MTTTSFPYLAVARDHGVPYAEVLRLSDLLDRHRRMMTFPGSGDVRPWMRSTLDAWHAEQMRRRSS